VSARHQAPLWQLLIATIPHRHATLTELLTDLDAQVSDCPLRVRALLYRDNLAVSYGDKTRELLHAADAAYVSCIDDDDLLAPDGVRRVCGALAAEPDYVGFAVAWTRDGVPQIPVEHSLRHPRWQNGPDMLLRSVMQFNPIRREIALDGHWGGGYEAEIAWGNGVVAAGRCKNEAWLPPPAVYLYRERMSDTFKTSRVAMPADQIPALPDYPWLDVLATPESC
jgi:hypothetical protein